MKQTFITLLLLCLSYAESKAQDVYNEILKTSTAVANDTSKDLEVRKIATFKVDALKYMLMKTNELMPDKRTRISS